MRIAIDVYGGDHAPAEIIRGCALALQRLPQVKLLLFGDEKEVQSLAHQHNLTADRIQIFHAPGRVEMAEHAVDAIKTKEDSSLVRALRCVAEEQADAVVSAGNTGAVLAGATLLVRRIKGIRRPAIAPVMPSMKGPTLLIDGGANLECKPTDLAQFGLMGSIYMHRALGVENPKVGLVSNGAEPEKGPELVREAHQLMKTMPYNFIGNIEARDYPWGAVDVAVADGFSGNIVLKTYEGAASAVTAMLKQAILSGGPRAKLGAGLLKPTLGAFKRKMDYTEYGGALFLGVRHIVVKAHGSSNANSFYNAIRQAHEAQEAGVVDHITQGIASATPAQP